MAILAIDTSNSSGSIAIMKNKELLFSSFFNIKITHSETLMPEIARALELCNLMPENISSIAIAIGPGSFTGLRIGLATAKGFSFARKIPVVPISSLKIVALNYYNCGKDILVVQDAKMKEVYIALYSSQLQEIISPRCVAPEEIIELINAPTIAIGTGLALYKETLLNNNQIEVNTLPEKNYSKAESIFSILHLENINPSFDFEATSKLEPFYIRKSQAEVSRKQKL